MAKLCRLPVLLALIAAQAVYAVVADANAEFEYVGSTSTKSFYTGPWHTNLTWMQAQELCNLEHPGMRLASLETGEEEDIALSYLEGSSNPSQFWISATDFGTEGEFHWTKSGNRLDRTAETNNRLQNCLMIRENRTFSAERCNSFDHPSVWALCEIDANIMDPSTTTLPASTTTTPSPITTTISPSFECASEGNHPDPIRCNVFHVCVFYHGEFLDYEMTCPEFTNYCAQEETCGNPEDCPCDLTDSKKIFASGLNENRKAALVNKGILANDMVLVGAVGSKTFYTANRPNENWIFAMEFCHQNEMMLARMETEQERRLLVSYLNIGTYPSMFWLSGVDFGTEGEYYWMNNGTALYMVPYGNGGRDSNCLYLYKSGPLYDWSCENHRNWGLWPLCQVEMSNKE